jgi:hypothetical protein
MALAKYQVSYSPIRHNGVTYDEGETIELEPKEAKALKLGKAEKAEKDKEDKEDKEPKKIGDEQ